MDIKPDIPIVNTVGAAATVIKDGATVVKETATVVEAAATVVKAKTAKKKVKQTPKKSATNKAPVAAKEPATVPPLTVTELRETFTDAKSQIVQAAVTPVTAAIGVWTETLRDTVSGALAGLLGGKKPGSK